MDTLIAYIIIWVLAFIVGRIAANTNSKKNREKPVGTLRIDQSDPIDGPHLFLELKTDPRNLLGKKQIVLDVNSESYLSHE